MAEISPRRKGEGVIDATYRRHRHGLKSIARKAGDEDAADIAQEACLRLVEVSRTQPVAAPANLLFRIARNLVIDRLRARTRSRALFQPADPDFDRVADAPDQEHALIAAERLRRAIAVIDAMPGKRREVFLLHRLESLSYARIADRLGISIKTVEKHMSAAMAQLSSGMRGE